MAERDRFELDLMAALRDYAADAPIEVRPGALARQFAAAHAHGRTSLERWGLGRMPALAWLLVLAGLLLALLVGGLIVGGWPRDPAVVTVPSPSASPAPSATRDTSPILSLPLEMQGTWSTATTGEESAALTLGSCAVGEDCGRLDRIDDNGEHCTYGLVYGSGGADGFRLETGKGTTFGCAWSGWAANHVHLTRVTDGTVEILLGDHGKRIQLHRIEQASPFGSASPLAMIPSELVGTWASQDGKPVVLVLHSCSIGEPCGRIERVNEDGQYCVYPLEYRDGQGAQLLAFKPPIAGNVQCYWRPMTVVVQPHGDGNVLVFWDSSFWVTEQYTLRRLDGAPAGAVPPTGG